MKKSLLSVFAPLMVVAVLFTSCGGDEKKQQELAEQNRNLKTYLDANGYAKKSDIDTVRNQIVSKLNEMFPEKVAKKKGDVAAGGNVRYASNNRVKSGRTLLDANSLSPRDVEESTYQLTLSRDGEDFASFPVAEADLPDELLNFNDSSKIVQRIAINWTGKYIKKKM